MIKDYFIFAWNSLTNKKLRSWLTLLGICIGVLAVVSLISLGDGLRDAVSSQFGIASLEILTIQAGGVGGGPPGTGVVNPLTKDTVTGIERLSSIDIVAGRILSSVQVEHNNVLNFNFAMSLPSGREGSLILEILDYTPSQGRLLRLDERGSVFLGYNFGRETNSFGKRIVAGNSILINNQRFRVAGIAERKGSFIFDNIILMEESELRSLVNQDEVVDIIVARPRGSISLEAAREDVQEFLRRDRSIRRGEQDDFTVQTPEGALSTVNTILTGVQIFVAMVASISIIVGAIGIVNTMTTSVLERKQQIGIMKSIGAKNSDIFMQFFIESGLMGLIGGIFGVILGTLIGFFGTLSLNTFIGSSTVPSINIVLIVGALLGSFIIGAIAGIVPAIQAARQNPVDSLRG